MEKVNLQQVIDFLTLYGLKIVAAVVILIVGRIIAGSIRKGIRKVLAARRVDPGLTGFVSSLAYFGFMAFVLIAALAKFGIQTASFIAILGAAGFAVGMALQGTLANFASGVMILLFRPFQAGDFIEAAGIMGAVKEISIFSTVINTPDHVKIVVPNGKLYGDIIKNYNGNDTRRVDMVMSIGYGSDINRAIEVINGLIAGDKRVLPDPAATVAVGELASSSVKILVRPWVGSGDYWDFYFDFHKNCKEAFDAAGIEIPFPQQTVHMAQAKA